MRCREVGGARARGRGSNRAVFGLLDDGVSAVGGHYVFCLWDDVIGTNGELARRSADRGVVVGAELDGSGAGDQAAFATEQARLSGGKVMVQPQQPLVE